MANANALLTAGVFNTYLEKLKNYIDTEADDVSYRLQVDAADPTTMQLIEVRTDVAGATIENEVGAFPLSYVLTGGQVTTSGTDKYIEFTYAAGSDTRQVQIPVDFSSATPSAADLTLTTISGITATNVQSALSELLTKANVIKSYSMVKSGDTYQLAMTPGSVSKGSFTLGNDLVISTAEVEDDPASPGELRLKIVLSDSANTTLYAPLSGFSYSASGVSFKNTPSGLSASNVQAAIDELVSNMPADADIKDIEDAVAVLSAGLDDVVDAVTYATPDDIGGLFP